MALTKVPSNLDAAVSVTQSQSDNSTNVATTAYVDTAISNLSDSAPAALNTLNEIAAALGDDANYAATTTAAIAGKLPLAGGTMTGNISITKEDPALVLTDSSSSRTLMVFNDNNNSVVRASGALLLQIGPQSALTIDTSRNSVFAGTLGVTGAITSTSTTGLYVNSSDSYARVDLASTNNRFFLQVEDSSFDGFGIYDGNNSAWRMSVLTNGNVGIGNTAPVAKLHIKGAGTYNHTPANPQGADFVITSSEMSDNNAHSIMQLVSVRQSLTTGSGSTGYLGFSTIDDSNNTGINDAARIAIVNEAGSSAISATALSFWTNAGTGGSTGAATESMRIDSSGNLLVGTTNTNPAENNVNGISLYNDGRYFGGTTSNEAMRLNRKSTDGVILVFHKDGAPIGSIGTENGDLNINGGSGHSGIRFQASSLLPRLNGSDTNGTIDLGYDDGSAIHRFRNLYLSGTMLGNITKLRQHTSSMYVSPTNTNTLNGNLDADSDEGDMWINYRGYQDGFSRFRDFRIGNGKSGQIVFVDGSAASVAITGSLSVTSSFSKGSGSFKIDHPLEAKKDTHHLIHSFVEAPQADNIYRGKIDLVAGSATANIDTVAGMTEGTFVALNREVQCFTTNESNWDAVKGSVSGNILTVESENSESTATISWLVIGERKDQHMYDTDWTDDDGKVIVEPIKETLENA